MKLDIRFRRSGKIVAVRVMYIHPSLKGIGTICTGQHKGRHYVVASKNHMALFPHTREDGKYVKTGYLYVWGNKTSSRNWFAVEFVDEQEATDYVTGMRRCIENYNEKCSREEIYICES